MFLLHVNQTHCPHLADIHIMPHSQTRTSFPDVFQCKKNANSLLRFSRHFFLKNKCFLDQDGWSSGKEDSTARKGRKVFLPGSTGPLEGHKCAPSGTEKFWECLRPSSLYWSALLRGLAGCGKKKYESDVDCRAPSHLESTGQLRTIGCFKHK